jgi:hypothetical protein
MRRLLTGDLHPGPVDRSIADMVLLLTSNLGEMSRHTANPAPPLDLALAGLWLLAHNRLPAVGEQCTC